MDLVTTSLLREFAGEFDLTSLPESKQFEVMASYLTVKRHFSESFNPSDLITGGGGDLGIDALAVIVNGILFTDVDDLRQFLSQKIDDVDATFVFVQADRGSFDSAKLGTFAYGVEQFFDEASSEPKNDVIKEHASMMTAIYEKGAKFKRGNPKLVLYYATTGTWPADGSLNARKEKLQADLFGLHAFREVDIVPIGVSDVAQLYRLSKHAITRQFDFNNRRELPEIPGVQEAFVGFIPAADFISIVRDENGLIVKSLFYDNVRDFQGDNDVNSEIRDTLSSDRRQRFVLMNNGVTIITRSLRTSKSKFVIENFQIVNGCQTTNVLFNNQEHLNDSVMVPLRLIWTQDEDVIADIIRATNRQTEVKEDQFFANTDFARRMETYFVSHPVPERLYYESRSRQYDSQEIEKTRIINQTNIVRAFASVFLEEPHSTVRSYNSLSEKIEKTIFAENHKMVPYYTAASIYYRLDRLFHNLTVDRKFKVARHQIVMTVRLLLQPNDPPHYNSKAIEQYCEPILSIIWDKEKSADIINKALQIITELDPSLDRDTIHTQAFTHRIKQLCIDKAT